ncbi:hypothetical protein AMTR_s00012p00150540 [Amborella trichopoda]|uniref:Uncharacterized protein n=1 Tax=Amborella trichopoda TaxID=13333 RepID=W1PIH7_AMBTC|nr:hypothetical protein AMTR_s00012p00150540 [Amborella trichopoda]
MGNELDAKDSTTTQEHELEHLLASFPEVVEDPNIYLQREVHHEIIIMGLDPFGHDPYKSGYAEDNDFFETYKGLKEDGDVIDRYHLKDGLLFNNGKSCVPKDSRLKLIQEAHRSPLVRHFGKHKMVADANRI